MAMAFGCKIVLASSSATAVGRSSLVLWLPIVYHRHKPQQMEVGMTVVGVVCGRGNFYPVLVDCGKLCSFHGQNHGMECGVTGQTLIN